MVFEGIHAFLHDAHTEVGLVKWTGHADVTATPKGIRPMEIAVKDGQRRSPILLGTVLAASLGVGLALFGGATMAGVGAGILALRGGSLPSPSKPSAEKGGIATVVSSASQIWNAVVADGDRYLLSGPRWAGNAGTQLSVSEKGVLRPFPDVSWNDWKPGGDGRRRFVNINALRRGPGETLWVVDTGAPDFGGDPLPDAAKLVVIDLKTNRVIRIIRFSAQVARKGSYIDDIRFKGDHAYLTDAGNPGIIVLDLTSGHSRRVLDGDASTVASPARPIILDGQVLKAPDNRPLLVNSDPLEVSPDGHWLWFGPLEGPWSRVPTRLLDDPSVSAEHLARAVRPLADIPPMGGSVMDAKGNLYFSDLKADAIRKRSMDGRITTIASDPRLHWVDAMFITSDGRLLMPAAQIDRVPLFNHGLGKVQWPVSLFSLHLGGER